MTSLRAPSLFKAATVLAAFAFALGAFWLLSRSATSGHGGAPAPADLAPARPGASTDAQIAALQRISRGLPADPRGWTRLGLAYLQKVRETGDAGFYTRAQGVIAQALRLAPHSADTLAAAGQLALARHDFSGGLARGRAALAAAPARTLAYPVIVDAEVELGRYGAAEHHLQRLVDLKPTLAAYARVSYFRELHGDLPGAVSAMSLAASASGDAPENVAYVQTLLGGLELAQGRVGPAAVDYRLALARLPGYVPAIAGLARVDAARDDLGAAAARWRVAAARLPLPEYVIGLGETELAAGHAVEARHDLALLGAEERLLRAAGVNVDVDLALFEANHGSPARAVALARRAWTSAPGVRSADALGWALTRAGQAHAALPWTRRALALGTRDATFLYHAGMTARAAGRRGEARTWLRASLAGNPEFNPLYAPRARRALAGLR